MKKILLAIIVGFGFILNANAVSKATIKEYTKNYMLEKYNWGDEQYIALVNLVNKESGWNYKAKNKNGACGLYQAYPCKKMKKFGKNYKTSYKVQTKWGLNYIYYRYGSPVNAWSFWQRHYWY